jgi:DNA-dependent protein kinase catalytic subunit
VALSQFSQWLQDFDPSQSALEVPGQYSALREGAADCAPCPHAHERVVAVEATVLVMASKQRPKRVAMLGSSGRRHVFLVKGGEDLRNDERVQQLFALMNAQVRALDSNTVLAIRQGLDRDCT